jgi:hypothetical protein
MREVVTRPFHTQLPDNLEGARLGRCIHASAEGTICQNAAGAGPGSSLVSG